MENKLTFTFALVVALFYIPMLFFMFKVMRQKQGRRYFFKAVKSILDRVPDNVQALEQIIIAYRKLSERYPHISKTYKSPRDFMEDFLCRSDALERTTFQRAYLFEVDHATQQRVFNMVTILRDREPFAALSSSYGNLLGLIRQAVYSNNTELAQSSLKQLADELEITEKTMRTQDRRNAVSMIISIVGVILTIVFGAVSLAPLVTERVVSMKQESHQTVPR